MKTSILLGIVVITFWPSNRASAQIEIINEAVKQAIMAIDLSVQKLQTQTIFLQDAQQELQNAMEATRLADITNWVQQQKDLYAAYYQELWQVKNVLTDYSIVKNMVAKQIRLVSDYKKAYAAVVQDPHFTAGEINHIAAVYTGILNESVQNINQLSRLIGGFITQMDDGDRLQLINAVGTGIDRNYAELEGFTQENVLLSLQRSKEEGESNRIKALYGIQY
ncbi:MAG TPA: conjugal transfer protein TraI [Puia sp.]